MYRGDAWTAPRYRSPRVADARTVDGNDGVRPELQPRHVQRMVHVLLIGHLAKNNIKGTVIDRWAKSETRTASTASFQEVRETLGPVPTRARCEVLHRRFDPTACHGSPTSLPSLRCFALSGSFPGPERATPSWPPGALVFACLRVAAHHDSGQVGMVAVALRAVSGEYS